MLRNHESRSSIIVKSSQRSLLSLRVASAGNSVEAPNNRLRLKPDPVRALASFRIGCSSSVPSHDLTVFELPDETILSILSRISPDLRLADHYPRFRIQCSWGTDDYHHHQVEFLQSLVLDDGFHAELDRLSSVHRMPRAAPESPHGRDGLGWVLY